jgi:hypothetical protein
MQCRDAQFYLRLRRHTNDELGADVVADLDRHIVGCPACALDSRIALSFDRAIATAMKTVAVPTGLRDKLLTQVLAYRGTVLRRKAYRLTALAASLFLVIGLGYGVFSASRPKLDTIDLVMRADEQIQDPDRTIQLWLTAQHFPAQLPLPLNADLLVSLGSERIQGQDVPVIIYRGPTERGFAKVYLFRESGEFKLDSQSLQDAQASNTSARVLKSQPQAPGVVYVIVYTERDLQPFLRAGSAL